MTNKVIIVIVYINNFSSFGPYIQEINTIKKYLADQYKRNYPEQFGQFTAIEQDRNTDKKTISLSEELYLRKTIDHIGMSDCKPTLLQ